MRYTRLIAYMYMSFVLLNSCKSPNEEMKGNRREYKTKYFSIMLPRQWNILTPANTDAHLLTQFTSEKDTITVEVSCYASSLTEYDPDILPKSVENKIDSVAKKNNYVIFLADEKIKRGLDIDEYRKQNIIFKNTSNGYKVKLITPRKSGVGIMGMYCDSIGMDNAIGRLKINMYGKNLSSQTEQDLQKIIEGIIFINQDIQDK